MNLHEFYNAFILFYFILFDLFRIYTNLSESLLKIFENTHTAALPDSRTLPRALLHTAAH
jgi:hypothetical protein